MASSSFDYREAAEPIAAPPFRRLRGYAFDPSLSLRLDTAAINHAVFNVAWEHKLDPGPIGEYVEVVDYDPASGCWYDPVDLNDRHVLAQDGIAPSEGNPQFHQQMVYAVAMKTIAHFEHALGRQVFWAPNYDPNGQTGQREAYVKRLRIYPHALRAANAYYSPAKKSLLFGYFPGPSGMVFSCLSHDIVAHETTHALLDGMHRRYIEDNHEDALAFHEAFADLVAMFQHFTFPEVLKHQIAKTRGDLESPSLLGELAQQFGEATGRYGALRSAIGDYGSDGKWQALAPDPERLRTATEPHERGSILVAAVFAAFLAVYKSRTRHIVSLATSGSGVLPEGALHPTLIAALAARANKIAEHFLNICVRALDYCPPFDITFGDYLRALITADFDLVRDDKHGYRIALIESFRRWGIVPGGLRTLSEEQLRWPFAKYKYGENWDALTMVAEKLRPLVSDALYLRDREQLFEKLRAARQQTHEFVNESLGLNEKERYRNEFSRVTGLYISPGQVLEGLRYTQDGSRPSWEVHGVRPVLRVGPDGAIMKQLIMVVTQRRQLLVDPAIPASGTFDFRGGSTLIFDLEGEKPQLRYAITRPIDDDARLGQIRSYRREKSEGGASLRSVYFGKPDNEQNGTSLGAEPFCMLHEH